MVQEELVRFLLTIHYDGSGFHGWQLQPDVRTVQGDIEAVLDVCDAARFAPGSAGGEGMIVDEGVIVEIVTPGTGDPVPEGEVGEVGGDRVGAGSVVWLSP